MVSFIEAIKLGYQKTFNAHDCSTRAEYWWWVLYHAIFVVLLAVALLSGLVSADFYNVLYFGWLLIHFIPNLTLNIRRLHDIGKSGWWILLGFIPLVGFFILLYFYLQPSDPFSEYREEEE